MAATVLSQFTALVDAKLLDKFNEKKPDPVKARKGFARLLETAEKQFKANKPNGGSYKLANGVLVFAPKLKGKPILIDGKESLPMPAERFPDALKLLKKALDAGELDAALIAEAPAKPAREGKRRGPMTQEQKDARNATRAKNKAAKEAEAAKAK